MVFLRISGKAPRHDWSRGGQIIPSSLKVAKPYHLNIHLSRVTTIYGMHTISTSLEGENHTNISRGSKPHHLYISRGPIPSLEMLSFNQAHKARRCLKLSPTDPLTDSRWLWRCVCALKRLFVCSNLTCIAVVRWPLGRCLPGATVVKRPFCLNKTVFWSPVTAQIGDLVVGGPKAVHPINIPTLVSNI